MTLSGLLDNPTVRSALRHAWKKSEPRSTGGHEEGGFIVMDPPGNVEVIRWEKGEQSSILLPPHANCRIDDKDIIASIISSSEYIKRLKHD